MICPVVRVANIIAGFLDGPSLRPYRTGGDALRHIFIPPKKTNKRQVYGNEGDKQ
jgi:hypothetical protein